MKHKKTSKGVCQRFNQCFPKTAVAITVASLLLLIFAFPILGFGSTFDSANSKNNPNSKGNNAYPDIFDDPYDTGDKTLSPYFFVESEDAGIESFPLKQTDVNVNIDGVIADIYVVQTYANEGDIPINATYVFPASTRAAVHGMTMQVGDIIVTAQIKEREEARGIYEEAKNEGKSTALLEQQRPNVFTMDLANIMPGDIAKIELHYSELIVPTEGVYEFVFPTVVGPRYSNQKESEAPRSDQWVANPYLHEGETTPDEYNINVNLSTGVPIFDLKCKSHEVVVDWNGKSAAGIALKDTGEYAGNRDFILEYKLTGGAIQAGLMLDDSGTENFFMLMVQPPERVDIADIPLREYIFVLDVSGSMEGYPIETAKELVKNLVSGLRNEDLFNLILFSGTTAQLSPMPVKASQENIENAVDMIYSVRGGGGTELYPALLKAIENPISENVSRNIVVITDGMINAEAEVFNVIRENMNQTSFFSFGIGSSVNRLLIEGIAAAGMGESFVVTNADEAAKTADHFLKYIESPVLTDIKVEFSGFDVYDVEPQVAPVLFSQRPITLLGKWRGQPSGSITITGRSGGKDYVQEIRLSDVAKNEAGTAISLLWARERVKRLTDYGNNQNKNRVEQEVTEIGLEYSLLTPYTSFVAVIETIRNDGEERADVTQPLPLPQGVTDLAVGGLGPMVMEAPPTGLPKEPDDPANEAIDNNFSGSIMPVLLVVLIAVAGGIAATVWIIRKKHKDGGRFLG